MKPSEKRKKELREEYFSGTPSARTALVARLAEEYDVVPSTVRRWFGPLPNRKKRTDAGEGRAPISDLAFGNMLELHDGHPDMSIPQIIRYAENRKWIAPRSISPDALSKRIAQFSRRSASDILPTPTPTDDSLIGWCRRHIRIRKKKWSLDRHEYLKEIYESLETHPHIVFRKGAQVGISTAVILGAMWACDQKNAKSLYYVSTDEDVDDFSGDRIDPIIEESEHLDSITGRTPRDDGRKSRKKENINMRHIGAGTLYCRGMWTKRKVKSIDGDILILDELDECDQENRKFAEDRIAHSEIQHIRELSQPSIPEYGIDVNFARSDRRHWFLECEECGEMTCLELDLDDTEKLPTPKNIRPVPEGAKWARPGQKYYRACRGCHSPLDMARGEWVPQNPNSIIRGYHVSALYTQICSPLYADPADRIMEKIHTARTAKDRAWVTISIFGFPYGGENQPITDQILDEAEGGHGFRKGKNTYIGIDQGDVMHAVIGEMVDGDMEIVSLAITDSWSELQRIFESHNARAIVGDALPNKSEMKALARATGGHITYFGGEGMKVGEEGDVGKITVDRSEALDEAVRWIVDRELVLPDPKKLDARELSLYEAFRAQVKMLVKNIEESARGVARWHYISNVENHFGMALAYMILAHAVAPKSRGDFSLITRPHRRHHMAGFDDEAYL